jgi:hypothetical protein
VGSAQVPGSQVRSLQCPNCGGTVTLRGYAHTLTVVCVRCLSVLDAKSPNLQVLQDFQNRERFQPLIPLGTRGKWHGDKYEVIGFQVREIVVDYVAYRWSEYLLFNPYKGFRYLTEYQGHWNDVTTVKAVPEQKMAGGKPVVKLLGETYKHFQAATAETIYVMGEFPWRVEVGERVAVNDFVAPPRMLSAENTNGEVTWSLGEYTTGEQVWKAFALQGKPPAAIGIFANQPSPYKGRVASVWMTWLLLTAVLLLVMLFVAISARRETAFRQSFTFSPNTPGEHSFVTPIFELKGGPSSVEVKIYTNLDNDWVYFSMALINEEAGEAWDFGREVSYYYGRDSDGSWTEGSKTDVSMIPRVPPGRYYLRIEPEMETKPDLYQRRNVAYSVEVRRDVPTYWPAAAGFLLLLVPPALVTWRSLAFESSRWQESDYATTSGSDD